MRIAEEQVEKVCRVCNLSFPTTWFNNHKGSKDGLRNDCKTCRSIYTHAVYKRTEGIKARQRGLRRNINGRGLDPVKAKSMGIRRNNKRKAANLNSLPKWYSDFDDFVLSEASELCKLREETTGIKWSIDHVVPFQHKDACGLHWHKNIQVVPHSWNCKKKNLHLNSFWDY